RVWSNTDAFEILAGPSKVGSDGECNAIAVAHLERTRADETARSLDADQVGKALFGSEGGHHLRGTGGVFIHEQHGSSVMPALAKPLGEHSNGAACGCESQGERKNLQLAAWNSAESRQ